MNLSELLKGSIALRLARINQAGQIIDPRNRQLFLPGDINVAAALRLLPKANPATALAADSIVDIQHPALGKFWGVRLQYDNLNTAAAMTINAIAVAPCPAHASGNGTTLSWVDGAFGGAAGTTVSVASIGAQIIPTTKYSDFIPVSPIARTDYPSKPYLLRARSHLSAGAVGINCGGAETPAYNSHADNPGLQYAIGIASGAAGVLKTAAITPASTGGAGYPIIPSGVVFYYGDGYKSLYWFGDSLFQGVGPTPAAFSGAPSRVVWDSYATGKRISCINYGHSGQTIADSYKTLLSVLSSGHRPTHVVWKPWSINSGSTQANYDDCWAKTLHVIDYLHQLNVVPVLLTCPPVNSNDWAKTQAINALTMALPGSCIKVDLASMMNDPANPGFLKSEYDCGDHTHWSELGHADAASAVIEAVY